MAPTRTDALAGLLSDALTRALGEDATLVAAWRDPIGFHIIYAFPSVRLATLAHWRDEVEFYFDDAPVVAMEASKWARLLLKSHGGTLLCSVTPPLCDPLDLAESLTPLAASLWDKVATEWAQARGLTPLPHAPAPAEDRFERVNNWLLRVRRATDRGHNHGGGPDSMPTKS